MWYARNSKCVHINVRMHMNVCVYVHACMSASPKHACDCIWCAREIGHVCSYTRYMHVCVYMCLMCTCDMCATQ